MLWTVWSQFSLWGARKQQRRKRRARRYEPMIHKHLHHERERDLGIVSFLRVTELVGHPRLVLLHHFPQIIINILLCAAVLGENRAQQSLWRDTQMQCWIYPGTHLPGQFSKAWEHSLMCFLSILEKGKSEWGFCTNCFVLCCVTLHTQTNTPSLTQECVGQWISRQHCYLVGSVSGQTSHNSVQTDW